MMEHFLTKETFRKGLNRYLTQHGNSTVVPDYLFAALQEQYDDDYANETAAGLDTSHRNLPIFVKTIMDTWTLQNGYPVITVTRSYTSQTATVTQNRFLLREDSSGAGTGRTYRWWVPLTYTSQANPNFTSTTPDYWLTGLQVNSWTINLAASQNQWVLFNIQQTGFYRVNYDARNWGLLSDYLNSEFYDEIHVLNRAQLLDDAFNLARAGTLGYTTALQLSKYLTWETDYVPWYSALTAFSYIDRCLRGLGEYDHYVFQKYILGLMENIYQELRFEELAFDDYATKLHRNLILQWQCDYGVRTCTDRATSEFAAFMSDPDAYYIPPDLKRVIYCNGLRYGGEAEFNFLWDRYLNHNVNTEQVLILGVMGCTRTEALAHRFLRNTITNDSFIRAHDMSRVYPSVYNNPYGVDFAINFLLENYQEIIAFNSNQSSSLGGVVSGIAGAIYSQEQLIKLRDVIANITANIGANSLLNNLQSAETNLQWLQTHGRTISDWVKRQDYRLPTSIVPEYYHIVLRPNLDDGTFQFEGRVNITFWVASNTDRITLHAYDLDIDAATISLGVDVSAVTVDTVRQFYDIKLQEELVAGRRYRMHIFYKGYHREDMAGFYRSYYLVNGTRRWLASTQFQATSARRAFPCFDEPGFKARFKFIIGRTADRRAISNMPLEYTESDEYDEVVWDHFQETPMPMSTYLTAFVVSDFTNLSSSDGFFSTWQRPAATEQARYSVDVSPRILSALENYTGVDYFLPKMDQVAVPDFSAGAMENWGLVTYREQMILLEDGVSPSSYRQSIATVIAHEFAHMWFGNLVSPKWWSYTWLNEGFARYFQFFGAHMVENSWRLDHQFVVSQVHSALSTDSSATAHSLTVDVGSPSSISSIFGTITYNKGASVIRMMEYFMTPETFRRGLGQYLTTYGNSTAEPKDLFSSLDEEYLKDFPERVASIEEVMNTWTLQNGYPLITVTRDYATGAVTVSQERFLLRRSSNSAEDGERRWWVPLTYTSRLELDFDTTTRSWMRPSDTSTLITDIVAGSSDWVIFNLQEIGFYRVNYDSRNWELIAEYLDSDNYENIHLLNRAQLLDDGFNLAQAGVISYPVALRLTRYLSREVDYIPWMTALSALNLIERRLRGRTDYDYGVFQNYMEGLLERVYQTVGLEEAPGDSHHAKLHRSQILTWVCRFGDPRCVNMSVTHFSRLMDDPDNYRVPPDLKSVVYCNGLRYGGEAEFNFLWNRYLNHNVNTEQILILGLMGCTRNETLAHRFLRLLITEDNGIRSQDRSSVTSSVISNHYGVDFAISYLYTSFRDIITYENSTSGVTSLISSIAGALSSQEQLNQLRQFITTNSAELGASATAAAQNSLGSAELNLQWLAEHGDTVITWLKQQDYRLPTSIVPEHYVIHLVPRLDDDDFTFDGQVQITVRTMEATSRIVLHADDVSIDESSVSVQPEAGGVAVGIAEHLYDPLRHFYIIRLSEELVAGQKYNVSVDYGGFLRDDMAGFYRSSYRRGNQTRWLASTHFEATQARRAFPCFDEPALKATFQVNIARTADRHSLSNMPVASIEQDTNLNLTWDHFEQTPMPMSTYLVAFVVSDFVNETSADGFYRTWQRAEVAEQARYSTEVSPALMSALENYTQLEYFLPKLDQVAVPDFRAGAMENWGLVTYREPSILFAEGVSPSSYRQSIANVIAHEFTHKWFGNLVSPAWWSYLWLNEGFARFFQYFASAQVNPSWRLDEQFVTAVHQSAMSADSLASTHALSADVGSPTEIRALFSTITYGKGAAVIRMVQHFLTDEVFRLGLVDYLRDRGNSSATPDHLFRALHGRYEQSVDFPEVDMKTVLDSWSLQKGFPLVTVTRNYNYNSAIVTQDRFFLWSDEKSEDTNEYRWWIPLTHTSSSAPNFSQTATKTWMRGTQTLSVISDVGAASGEWLIFNVQQTGFYRVNYDVDNWNLLTQQLRGEQFSVIPPVSRAQLLDDSLNLARAGVLEYSVALNLTSYLSRETDYIPWYSALNAFSFLDTRLRGLGVTEHGYFKNYVVELLQQVGTTLGLAAAAGDGHVTRLHRSQVLSRLCHYEDPACVQMARSELQQLVQNPDTYNVDPDLKSVVYCHGLRYGGELEWEFLWDRFLNYDVSSEQALILRALGCTGNQTLAHRYLRKIITADAGIRSQDLSSVFPAVYNNYWGVNFAIEFLKENYREILSFNNNSRSSVTSLVSGIAGAVSTRAQLDQLRQFLTNSSAELGQGTESTLAAAERNLAWLAQHGSAVSAWLKSRWYRLTEDVRPVRYVLQLVPHLEGNFTFTGQLDVTFSTTRPTSSVILHADDLLITSVNVSSTENGTKLEVLRYTLYPDRHFLDISLAEEVLANQLYTISITYTGFLRDDMYGFYRSSYVVNGQRRWIATTQFEPTRARRAFPCFDEPGFKATFKISIARTADRHALSNMPVEYSEYDEELDLTWDHFQETPMPMSTYLVAFVVSDFRNLSTTNGFYSTWQREAAVDQARYSIEISPSIMEYLEDYTGADYFLPKMDQVAVPDFSSGAMENWGLVTYRERNILHVDGVSSAENRQRTADIISHEFAHQWFGNLISPKWWGDTWLNEGFGRYFQYFATAQVESSWRYEEQFVVRQVHQALSSDALQTSHPMSHQVATPSEVSAMFSTISYAKAASVIRMAKHFLGETVFRDGLRRYVTTYGNGTTEPDYLYAALQSEYPGSDFTVKEVLDTWVNQVGYPVISVTRDYATGQITVMQERFLSDGSRPTPDDSTWWVPLSYTTLRELDFSTTTPKLWLEEFESSATLVNIADSASWVLFNIQQTGFYRVNYDAENWRLLSRYLDSDAGLAAVHPVNRAQLLDDAFALAQAGTLGYATALELTRFLARETDYVPWYAALSALSHLDGRLRGAGNYNYLAFKTYVRGLLQKVLDNVGFEAQPTDSHVTKLLRGLVLKWACNLEVQNCISYATRQLTEHMSDPTNNRIDPDVANTVYCNGLRRGGEAEWEFLWNKYLSSDVSTEQVLLLENLGCTNTERLAHRYLNLTITAENGVRQQDISLVTSSVLNNPAGVDFAISYLNQHYQDIADFNGGSYSAVRSLVSGISGALFTQRQADQLREFVEAHQDVLGTSPSAALSSAERNLLWLSTHGPAVISWLQEQNYRLPTTLVPDTYVIRLVPDFTTFTFEGFVAVTVTAAEATDHVILHANDLSLNSGSISMVSLSTGSIITVADVVQDNVRHFLIVWLDQSLVAEGQYELSINYTGYMRDDMYGFYRSYYVQNGQRRWIATTQFQPTHARRAFPCFDEPAFKAKFNFSISVPAGYHALFNTRKIASSETEVSADSRRWEIFEQTPSMSTYLVAFVVSDFAESSNAAGNVSVWHRRDADSQARYAVNVSQPIVAAMERLVGHDYQLSKLDQAAIPDFSAGAMENWGLITYRERLILWDEDVSTTAEKRGIATTIGHEVAHMWFGNMVTLLWWSYTWLNEGFATYFQTFATTLVETDWRLDEQFVILHHQAALASDARETSRPMVYDVATPAQVSSVFDYVSYAKAGSVIRMMEHFLTRDVFLQGLQNYLGTHAYRNAEPDNLYAALQNASSQTGFSVKEVMDTWATQMGYPLVTVTRNYSTNTAIVEQERFLLHRSSSSADSHDYRWWIPLTYTNRATANFTNTAPATWLPAGSAQTTISDVVASPSDWLIFNLQETGYYRVNYDVNNWNLLTQQLRGEQFSVIPPVSRAQLLDDSLNLARAGVLEYSVALNLTSYLFRETDYIPWYSALTAFSFLDTRLRGAPSQDYQLFTNYVLRLVQNSYNSLGFVEDPTDQHATKLARALVLTWACNLGLDSCVTWARRELAQQMSNASHRILPDVSRVVYCTALRYGGVNEWNHLWRRYEASDSGTEQVLLLGVLGCTTDEVLINSYLRRSISENSGIRRQDASSVFSAVYSNPGGVDIAFNFLINNYRSISQFYGGMNAIGNILNGIAGQLSTREQADSLRRFVEATGDGLGNARDSSRRALESVEENLAWLGRYGEAIFDWLRHEESLVPTTTTTTTPATTTTTVVVPPTTTTTTTTTTTSTTTTTTTTTSTTPAPEPTSTTVATTTPSRGSNVLSSHTLLCIPIVTMLIRLAAM